MKFREFVKIFVALDNDLGRLAQDIIDDKDWDDSWDKGKIARHLDWGLKNDRLRAMASAMLKLYELSQN